MNYIKKYAQIKSLVLYIMVLAFLVSCESGGSNNSQANLKSNNLKTYHESKNSSNKQLIIYWCGFGSDYCGQSGLDDVNAKATIVSLAFGNIASDGSVEVDAANMPNDLINKWHGSGKRVILSVGGQNADWTTAFSNNQMIANFNNSLIKIVETYNLDGVDLDIENGIASQDNVVYAIKQLKILLGERIITIAPQNVGVYQALNVTPGVTNIGGWNYFVPILESSIDSIDYVAVQAYNNWYGGDGYNPNSVSVEYLMNTYLNWINSANTLFPSSWGVKTIPNWSGVPQSKLILGVLSSPKAGIPAYAPTPDMIASTVENLATGKDKVDFAGFMLWDSHWDMDESYEISNAAASALGL